MDDYRKLYELYEDFGSNKNNNIVFYFTSQPIPYKKLLIYPVKTIYYMFFHTLVDVFFANRYDTGLLETLAMKNLDFLFYENKEHNINNPILYLPMLECLLRLCLRKDKCKDYNNPDIDFIVDGKAHFILIDGEKYDWKDYEEIKEIICEQNCIELPDYKIHPDIRKKLAEKDRLLAKVNKNKIASFDELIDCLMIAGHFTEEYILNLPIRRFTNLLKRYDIMKGYELLTILSPNMDKKDRENIVSWNSAIPKQDQYLSKVTNIQEINSKINQANGG